MRGEFFIFLLHDGSIISRQHPSTKTKTTGLSYNFLPLEVAEAIDKGLEIKEEMQQLYKVMDKEKTRRDEANDKLVNTLLFTLSLLTMFSAIWDMSSLLNAIFPYSTYMHSEPAGFRVVTLLLLASVGFLLLIIYRRKKRE